jgi:HSP20 family protein
MMTLNPVSTRTLRTLTRDMDGLFEALRPSSGAARTEAARTEATWAPRADLLETEDAFVLTFDLPGVGRDDLSINYEDQALVVHGARRSDLPEGSVVRRERVAGTFRRTFALPRTIDVDAIEATYTSGVLSVRLPKTEASRPRQIDVQ